MRNIVQGTGSAAGSVRVQSTTWDGTKQRGHHLRRVHDCVTTRFLPRQLVNHGNRLSDHDLVFVVQQFYQLRDCLHGQIGVVLTAPRNNHATVTSRGVPNGGFRLIGDFYIIVLSTIRPNKNTNSVAGSAFCTCCSDIYHPLCPTLIRAMPACCLAITLSRERTIQARTDTIRYEYSSIHNGRYRYRYEYSVRWCPSHL